MLQKALDDVIENARRRLGSVEGDSVAFLESLSDFASRREIAGMCARKHDPDYSKKNAALVAISCRQGTSMLQSNARALFEVKKFGQHRALGFSWAEYCEQYLDASVENVDAFIASFLGNEACGGEMFHIRCETAL